MRKILSVCTLIIVCFNTMPSMAQDKHLSNRHEIRVGAGAVMYPGFGYAQQYEYSPSLENYYSGNIIGTPSINLSYNYQFKKWLSFGVVLSYYGVSQKKYNLYTDALYEKKNEHFVSLTPIVRFNWVRTKNVNLYSTIGIGLGYHIEKEEAAHSGVIMYYNRITPTIDWNPIGISIGRKLFGFCELGVSSMGFIKAGIGYKFNDLSKR